jgi:hypothetical protein
MSPTYGPLLQSAQLCRDKVRIHLYGCDNLMANNFVDFIQQYSYDWMIIGMATSPIIKDMKQPQSEFKVIAQRKLIEVDVNYNQGAVRDIARQLIEHVKVTWYNNDP